MRLTQEESERNRKQILEVAGRLFRQRGFDGAGVDDLMKAAGFTHGGFYNHFASKAELEAEAGAKGVAEAIAMLVESLSDPRKDGWERFVRGYLCSEHRREPGTGCTAGPVAAAVAQNVLGCAARVAEARQGMDGALADALGG